MPNVLATVISIKEHKQSAGLLLAFWWHLRLASVITSIKALCSFSQHPMHFCSDTAAILDLSYYCCCVPVRLLVLSRYCFSLKSSLYTFLWHQIFTGKSRPSGYFKNTHFSMLWFRICTNFNFEYYSGWIVAFANWDAAFELQLFVQFLFTFF